MWFYSDPYLGELLTFYYQGYNLYMCCLSCLLYRFKWLRSPHIIQWERRPLVNTVVIAARQPDYSQFFVIVIVIIMSSSTTLITLMLLENGEPRSFWKSHAEKFTKLVRISPKFMFTSTICYINLASPGW